MTERQLSLARHALGLPNSGNQSWRNHFCAGPAHEDYGEWMAMVEAKLAIRRAVLTWGGDDVFHLTFRGALEALLPGEHLSAENTDAMRRMRP